jgi:hypothetical protein
MNTMIIIAAINLEWRYAVVFVWLHYSFKLQAGISKIDSTPIGNL